MSFVRVVRSLPSPILPNPDPGSLQSLRWLGRKLQHDLYQVAAATGRRGKNVWTAAGRQACRDLAQALHEVLPGSVFVYLCDGGDCSDKVDHVAVFWRGAIFDADGATLPREWVNIWSNFEGLQDPAILVVQSPPVEMTSRGREMSGMLRCSLGQYVRSIVQR